LLLTERTRSGLLIKISEAQAGCTHSV